MTADKARSEDSGAGQPPAWQEWQLAGSLPENYGRHLVPALFAPQGPVKVAVCAECPSTPASGPWLLPWAKRGRVHRPTR
jgi:hypothetical protein